MLKIIIFFLLLTLSLNAYETEDKLKVIIVGKIAKHIVCSENNFDTFTITVLNDPFEGLFDKIYLNRRIKSKPVKIVYIDKISDLNSTNILYIPQVSHSQLSKILKETENQDILTISDNRGFASKGGVIQLYFVSQKLKLKINTSSAKKKNIQIAPILLRISNVVKGDSL